MEGPVRASVLRIQGYCGGDVAGNRVPPRRGLIVTVAATLPLAFVMIAGAQIISSFFFATSDMWKAGPAPVRTTRVVLGSWLFDFA